MLGAQLTALLENPLFVMFLAVFAGMLLGDVEVRGFTLGISGTLFAGLVLGHFGLTVPHSYFTFSLALFVAAVGLMASQDIGGVVRQYGAKCVTIGVVMPTVAAALTFLGVQFLGGDLNPLLVEGTFTGALTSSPGLGASLEAVSPAQRELVTVGYSVAYPLGVVLVILFEQGYPLLAGIDLETERQRFKNNISRAVTDGGTESTSFSLAGFALAVVLGAVVGAIPIPLGPVGTVSLGVTGGTLLTALALGYVGRVGPIEMRMSSDVLVAVQSLTLGVFLAVAGIEAGAGFLDTVATAGAPLLAITFVEGVGAIVAGLALARYVWDLDWVVTAGAISGGMTSTPGLGAAIDAAGTEEVGAGYGSTYPFALIGMVIFAKLLGLGL